MPLLVVAWTLVVLTSYWLGRRISDESNGIRRKNIFVGRCGGAVVILGSIKYLRVILRLIVPRFGIPDRRHGLVSTLGISYYTLQAVSYLADVYLGRQNRSVISVVSLLYLGFFPKLLQGPIERAGDLLLNCGRLVHSTIRTCEAGFYSSAGASSKKSPSRIGWHPS